MNFTERIENVAQERIKVGKEEAGTSTLNQAYDKLQVNQDRYQTRQTLEMSWKKVHILINQWQLILVVSTAIQMFPPKSGQIPLFLSTLILFIICIFMTGSRILFNFLSRRDSIFLEPQGVLL